MPARHLAGRHITARIGRIAALALALALPAAAARADSANPAALEAELRDWLAAVLGPHAGLGPRPVQLVPQGDHLALTIPIAGPIGQSALTLDGPPLTAVVRSLDGGRWALDTIRLPAPLRIVAPGAAGDSVWTVTMQHQDQHAVIDPRLATTSTWDGSISGYAMQFVAPGVERHSEAAGTRTHLAWQPAGGGRLDLTGTASSDLVSASARTSRLGLVSFSAARAQLSAHIDALAPARLPPLLHAAFDLTPLLLTAADAPPRRLSPALRTALADMLDITGDLLGGAGEQITLENVHVHTPDFDAALRRVALGANAAAPDGRLRLRLHLALDGLDSGALPAGPLHAYLPQHIAFTPRLSGLAANRVLRLLRAALARGADDPALAAEAQAVLREGPLMLGIDELAADFGPTTLAATGEVRIAGPDQVAGQVRIRATGLEALIHDASQVPMLRQALPVLIFLKGIGEPEGTATVWNVAYADGRLTVNGTDLSQMLPGR